MPESYFELDNIEQKDILQTAASHLGRSATVLEKDIWVCWVLEKLFSMPNAHPMAFKGGTSLSKVYNAINRFSEDVDITLDYSAFKDECNPLEANISKTQIKKFSDRLKKYVKSYSYEIIVPYFKKIIGSLPDDKNYHIRVDDTGEKVWISYPSAIEENNGYLKSEILIELGGRNVINPNEKHLVIPNIAPMTPTLKYSTAEVVVLAPQRTFWEKATLIHVECHRNKLSNSIERLSRHWYDLHMLYQHPSGQDAIENSQLMKSVVDHKKIFFNASYANYDLCLQQNFQLIPNSNLLQQLEADYAKMVEAGMLYGRAPGFEEIISSVKEIESHINKL